MINRRTSGKHGAAGDDKLQRSGVRARDCILLVAVVSVTYCVITLGFGFLGGNLTLNPASALDPKGNGLTFNDVFFYAAALTGFAGFLLSIIYPIVNEKIKIWLESYGAFAREVARFLLERKALAAIVVALTVVTLGFEVANPISSIDEEAQFPYKPNSAGWAYEGRFGIGVFKRLFMVFGMFPPYVADFIAAVLLSIAGVVAMVVINRALSRRKITTVENAIFFGMFISFPPVWVEYLSFATYSIEISFAILLAISCIYFLDRFLRLRDRPALLWAGLSLIVSVSVYQALATVFLTMLIVYLTCLAVAEDDFNAKKLFSFVGKVVLISVVCMIVYLGMYMLSRALQTSSASDEYLAAMTGWGSSDGVIVAFVTSVKALAHLMLDNNKTPGMSGFILAVIMLAVSAVLSIFLNRKTKRILVPILICFVAIAPFSLWFVLASTAMPLRTLLAFPLAAAFAAFFLMHLIRSIGCLRYAYWAVCCAMVVLTFNQIQDINQLFYSDSLRSKADIQMAHDVALDIEKEVGSEIDLPIVFIGSFDTAENNSYIIKNPGTDLYWGGDALGYSVWRRTGEPARMHGLFLWAGYDLTFKTAAKDDKDLVSEVWPEDGSIVVEDDRILVRVS